MNMNLKNEAGTTLIMFTHLFRFVLGTLTIFNFKCKNNKGPFYWLRDSLSLVMNLKIILKCCILSQLKIILYSVAFTSPIILFYSESN